MNYLKGENYALFKGLSEDSSPGDILSVLGDCSEEIREEPGHKGIFKAKTR